jgi:two-component system chemotaxis sensor kinase CheA
VSLALEHVLAFLDDATSVLRGMVGSTTGVIPLPLTSAPSQPDTTISVVVKARGDLAGFTWSFPSAMAARIAERMVPGIEIDPSICEAAASELANVLTGRGLIALADRGVLCDIDPPEITTHDANGSTYVVGTDAGSISVTFHQAGAPPSNAARLALASIDPPPFMGTMYVLDASGQIVRSWHDTTSAPPVSADVFAAMSIDDGTPDAAMIQLALASVIGAPAEAWSILGADLPSMLSRRDGAQIVVHWQPVTSAGQIIGVAMFVLPLGAAAAVEPDDPAERNRLCVDALGLLDECDACVRHLKSDPTARHAIHRMFRAAHTIKGSTRGTQLRSVSDLAHHVEELLDVMRRREEPVDRTALAQLEADLRRLRATITAARPRAEVDDAMTVLSSEYRSCVVDLREAIGRLAVGEREALPAAQRAIQQLADGAERASLRGLAARCTKSRAAVDRIGWAGVESWLLEEVAALVEHVELYIAVHRESSSSEVGPSTLVSLASCIDTRDAGAAIAVMMEAGTPSLIAALEDPSDHAQQRAFAAIRDAGAMFEPARQRDDATLRFERAQRELLAVLDGLEGCAPEKVAQAREIANRLVWTPLSQLSRRLTRMARSLGAELGKHVEADVDLGDLLVAPEIGRVIGEILVHAVRNATDHGIEMPSDRVESGKDAVGHISVRAEAHGDRVRVIVSDDGRGIDVDRVREVAVARKFVDADRVRTMPAHEVLEFLFVPGFSTAASVTTVSGRGVGMDVIKTLAEAQGGAIHLTTERGSGTRVVLDLPFSPPA